MALNIFDRIEIAIACERGRREYKKELRAYDRAAGTKKNNKAYQPVYNNSTTATSNSYAKKPTETYKPKAEKVTPKEETVKKSSENTATNVQPETNNTKPNEASNPAAKKEVTPPKSNEASNPVAKEETTSPKSNTANALKTEQDINAEAQYPVEEAGAEKISIKKKVETVADAAMSGNVRIDNTIPGILHMPDFGVTIDTNIPATPEQSAAYKAQTVPNKFNPAFVNNNGTPTPIMPAANPIAQFNLNGVPGNMNTYANLVNQQHIVGQGRHKVDLPRVERPSNPPKAEPDKVDMTGFPDITKGMEIENYPKTDVRNIGVVEDKVSKEVDTVPTTSIFSATNDLMYPKYPYLSEVEKIALKNDYQICFVMRRTGLIDCFVFHKDGRPINNKGFVIDPGFIIDRRRKVFAGLYDYYEGMNAYPLFINGPVNSNGNKANDVINEELLTNLIVGGNQTVEGVKGMYTENFRELNRYVALITLPSKNSADRKYLQNRLISMYKDGSFTNILAYNPEARFGVVRYDRNSGTIILDSNAISKNFGAPYVPTERIQVEITKDGYNVRTGANIIDYSNNQ